jgi:hypothetical protein
MTRAFADCRGLFAKTHGLSSIAAGIWRNPRVFREITGKFAESHGHSPNAAGNCRLPT